MMIEAYVVVTHKNTYRKKFEYFKIKNRGDIDILNFKTFL